MLVSYVSAQNSWKELRSKVLASNGLKIVDKSIEEPRVKPEVFVPQVKPEGFLSQVKPEEKGLDGAEDKEQSDSGPELARLLLAISLRLFTSKESTAIDCSLLLARLVQNVVPEFNSELQAMEGMAAWEGKCYHNDSVITRTKFAHQTYKELTLPPLRLSERRYSIPTGPLHVDQMPKGDNWEDEIIELDDLIAKLRELQMSDNQTAYKAFYRLNRRRFHYLLGKYPHTWLHSFSESADLDDPEVEEMISSRGKKAGWADPIQTQPVKPTVRRILLRKLCGPDKGTFEEFYISSKLF